MYEKGRKITAREMEQLNLRPHEVCPTWNYTLSPSHWSFRASCHATITTSETTYRGPDRTRTVKRGCERAYVTQHHCPGSETGVARPLSSLPHAARTLAKGLLRPSANRRLSSVL